MVGSKAMMKKEFTDWLAQAAVQVATKIISSYLCKCHLYFDYFDHTSVKVTMMI